MAAQELEAAEADVQLKKKPRPNNPEEAEEFIKQVKIAVYKFADVIHSYEPYKIEDVYTVFVTQYYDLLSEDYFKDTSITAELLDGMNNKHPTCCLAAAVHYTLCQKLFNKFKESQSNVADQFLVEHKKFFTSIMGCKYDTGRKLMKAEKKEKEAKEMELKKQKAGQTAKVEKQEKKNEEPMDTNGMPTFISDSNDDDEQKGTKKKWIFNKKPTKPPSRKSNIML